jgi:tetratricopeptide (TPR) repeat protein
MGAASFISPNYDDAIEYSRLAIQKNPGNATAYRYLAASLAITGRPDEARSAQNRAYDLQPMPTAQLIERLSRFFGKREVAAQIFDAFRLAGAPTA